MEKSLSQRERGARVSGPDEGYLKFFTGVYFFCTPHPPLRGTLSRWERDLRSIYFQTFIYLNIMYS